MSSPLRRYLFSKRLWGVCGFIGLACVLAVGGGFTPIELFDGKTQAERDTKQLFFGVGLLSLCAGMVLLSRSWRNIGWALGFDVLALVLWRYGNVWDGFEALRSSPTAAAVLLAVVTAAPVVIGYYAMGKGARDAIG